MATTVTVYTEISHQTLLTNIGTLLVAQGWTSNRAGLVSDGGAGNDYELLISHTSYGLERFFALQTTGHNDGVGQPSYILLSGHDRYDSTKSRFNQPGRPVGVYLDPTDYFSTDVCANVNATINKRAVVYADADYCYVFIEVVFGCWEHLLFGANELLSPRQVSSADSDRSGQFYIGRPMKANRDLESGPYYVYFDADPYVVSGAYPTTAQLKKECGIFEVRGGGTKDGTGTYGGIFINRGTTNIDWASRDSVALSAYDTYTNLCLPQSSNNLRPMLPIETQVKTSSWYVDGYLRDLRIVNGISIRAYEENVHNDPDDYSLFPLPTVNRQGFYFEQTAQSYLLSADNRLSMPCLAVKVP